MIYFAAVFSGAVNQVFGWEDKVSRIRRLFNDTKVFGKGMRRLYLYFEGDVLVKTEHVHEHAEDAKAKGYVAREEKFVSAPHCGLILEDSECTYTS